MLLVCSADLKSVLQSSAEMLQAYANGLAHLPAAFLLLSIGYFVLLISSCCSLSLLVVP